MEKKMKSKASKVTPNKAAYRSELKKLARQVRYYAKNYGGYLPPEIRENYNEPKIVTKERLNKLKDFRKNIQEFIIVENLEGKAETVSGISLKDRGALKKKRKNRAELEGDYDFFQKEWAEHIIENFKDQNSFWGTSPKSNEPIGRDQIFEWIDQMISMYGPYKVAIMLADGAADGLIIRNEEAYEDGASRRYMARMMNYIDISEDDRRDWIDSFEIGEDPDEPKYADEGRIY